MTLCDSNRPYLSQLIPKLQLPLQPFHKAALLPRTERARRPPEAENRAHIPRAIASREAMLWQGCSLSPRELERKAPRSVWATELPASRPIRWIVRESREANRTDSPAFHRTDFATHPARPRTDSPAFYRTNFARAPARQSDGLTFGIPSPAFPRTESRLSTTSTLIQPLYNRFPTPHQPSGTSTSPQPTFNRHATASQSQPRRNRFQITFQPPEADKRTIPRLANIHDSTTLRVEGKGDGEGRAFPES